MGNPTPSQTSSTSTSAPWSGVQPDLLSLFSSGENAQSKVQSGVYAPENYQQSNGMLAENNAFNTGVNAAQGITGFANSELSPNFTSVANDPTLLAAESAADQPLTQALQTTVLPGINSSALSSGAYGGSRNALTTANALNDYQRNILNTNAGLANSEYQTLQGEQQQAPGLLAAGANLQTANATAATTSGTTQQNLLQNTINAQNNSQYAGLSQLASLLGLGTGYGSSSSSGTGLSQQASGLTQGIQGAAGLAGLLGSSGSLFDGIGSTLGQLLIPALAF